MIYNKIAKRFGFAPVEEPVPEKPKLNVEEKLSQLETVFGIQPETAPFTEVKEAEKEEEETEDGNT